MKVGSETEWSTQSDCDILVSSESPFWSVPTIYRHLQRWPKSASEGITRYYLKLQLKLIYTKVVPYRAVQDSGLNFCFFLCFFLKKETDDEPTFLISLQGLL